LAGPSNSRDIVVRWEFNRPKTKRGKMTEQYLVVKRAYEVILITLESPRIKRRRKENYRRERRKKKTVGPTIAYFISLFGPITPSINPSVAQRMDRREKFKEKKKRGKRDLTYNPT